MRPTTERRGVKSTEQIARSAYEKLSARDKRVVVAWRERGFGWSDSMVNSNAISATLPRVHPDQAARDAESDQLDELVLRRQQRLMPTDEALRRRETAEHETAHATVARALGLEVAATYVTSDGGRCLHARGTPFQTATVALAGQMWIGTFRSLEFPRGPTGCADDLRRAHQAVGSDMRWELGKAHRLCRELLADNRATILALADQLDRDGDWLP